MRRKRAFLSKKGEEREEKVWGKDKPRGSMAMEAPWLSNRRELKRPPRE